MDRSTGRRRRVSRTEDHWRGTRLLLVDGNNLLHALAGSAGEGPLRMFLARLQAALPAGTLATVLLDGAPDPGAPMHVRVRPGLDVRHAGRHGADQVMVNEVERHPFAARDAILAVTDDGDLRARVHRLGGRTQPTRWLIERLDEPPPSRDRAAPGASIGSTPPRIPRTPPDPDARRWQPGRGATAKRGNPRRGHPPGG